MYVSILNPSLIYLFIYFFLFVRIKHFVNCFEWTNFCIFFVRELIFVFDTFTCKTRTNRIIYAHKQNKTKRWKITKVAAAITATCTTHKTNQNRKRFIDKIKLTKNSMKNKNWTKTHKITWISHKFLFFSKRQWVALWMIHMGKYQKIYMYILSFRLVVSAFGSYFFRYFTIFFVFVFTFTYFGLVWGTKNSVQHEVFQKKHQEIFLNRTNLFVTRWSSVGYRSM